MPPLPPHLLLKVFLPLASPLTQKRLLQLLEEVPAQLEAAVAAAPLPSQLLLSRVLHPLMPPLPPHLLLKVFLPLVPPLTQKRLLQLLEEVPAQLAALLLLFQKLLFRVYLPFHLLLIMFLPLAPPLTRL